MMSNPFKISIQLVLIILKLFTYTADTFNITDLEIICSFMNITDTKEPPTECTSLAIQTKNMDLLKTISSKKFNLPLFLIDDSKNYFTWPEFIKKHASDYLDDIKPLKINYVALENTYKSQDDMTEDRPNFSDDLAKFFDDVKKLHPYVGFGLVIPTDIDWLKESLDVGLLNSHVDFFLLDSTAYRYCVHKNHQSDMNVLATKDDILQSGLGISGKCIFLSIGSFTELKKLGVDTCKLIYIISLVVESTYDDFFTAEYEEMSYSTLCSKKMSIHRKYCFSTIQNLFEKARLRISEKTLGIYVNGYDFDDFDGKCDCTTKSDTSDAFRGLKTIAGASREDKNDVSFYDCVQGGFPIILD